MVQVVGPLLRRVSGAANCRFRAVRSCSPEFLRVSSFTSTFRQRARFHQARPSRDIKGVFEVAVANERGQILDRKRYGRASFQRFLETRPPLA